MKEKNRKLFEIYDGYDRFNFPCGLKRATAGTGGEAILIDMYEKTALVDCGMAYCADKMIEKTKELLNGRNLDYIFISHSHYDHIGALSAVKKAFPEAKVVASAKAARVFSSDGAKKVMKELSDEARLLYSDISEEVVIGDMSVDIIANDGDSFDLGDAQVEVMETKGHTDCCLTYVLKPLDIMFTSESTGVLQNQYNITSAILKSYDDCVESALKCKAKKPSYIIVPHYGFIPQSFNDTYFDEFLAEIEDEKNFVQGWYEKGLSEEEVLEKYKERNWDESREAEQPVEAFLTNARVTIKVLK